MTKRMADFRREYGNLTLGKDNAFSCPYEQFNLWFKDIIRTDNYDPTAMLLSTIDEHGHPDARVVLLKGLDEGHFLFYTNYKSAKANDIERNPHVSLNFFWPFLSRQIRIKGTAAKVTEHVSDEYFASRPKMSRIAAHASHQSQIIDSRDVLENKMNQLIDIFGSEPVLRPQNWGGYAVKPTYFEYWQGRDNRLHDRITYSLDDDAIWIIHRLAP